MIARRLLPAGCLIFAGLFQSELPADPPDPAQEASPARADSPSDPSAEEPVAKRLFEDAELIRSLEQKAAPEGTTDQDPLLRVGQRMRDVQNRLVKADAGDETRGIQTEIVRDIDKLIEEVKKGGG